MATFEDAKKCSHYVVHGKCYRKVTRQLAARYADATQFVYNGQKNLGWFVPLDAKPKSQAAECAETGR